MFTFDEWCFAFKLVALTLVSQSQKESEFRRSQEEVIRLNRQIRDLSQVLHLGGGGSWSCLLCVCFCHATGHQQSLNVLPGKRAAEVVADAGAHRRQCPAIRAGQAKELVYRPEGAAWKVSWALWRRGREGGREGGKGKLQCLCFPTEKQKIWGRRLWSVSLIPDTFRFSSEFQTALFSFQNPNFYDWFLIHPSRGIFFHPPGCKSEAPSKAIFHVWRWWDEIFR